MNSGSCSLALNLRLPLPLPASSPKTINELRDRDKRTGGAGLQLGSPAMPQLAAVGQGPEDAFRRMGGKPFAIDVKFDGDRIQVMCREVAGAGGGYR